MTQPLYDIYFTGQLVEGAEIDTAKVNLAQLFKTNVESIAKLFNGKPQLLKRGVDKAAALKYKAALHKAGLLVAFKAHQAAQSAEKPNITNTQATSNVAQATPKSETTDTEFSLAPVGSDVLNNDEKRKFEEREIDTSNIKLVSVFTEPQSEEKQATPSPDTSHISVASVGEDLLIDKPEAQAALDFDLDDISVAPVGADLEQLHEDLPQVAPNINGISLAPVGSDINPHGGKKRAPRPPNTDHISIVES